HRAIDNTGNEKNSEQAKDNITGGKENNQKSNNETQHEQESKLQDNGNIKPRETGSSHTSYPEQKLRNPNISQTKGQPPLITAPPELDYFKGKLQYPNKGCNQPMRMILEAKLVNQSPYSISPQRVQKYGPTTTLLTTSYPSRSREKKQIQPLLLKTSPQNILKATRSEQDLRN
ncbi:MAG: hypothetical protein EZS28_052927, partial [Streblomastix strix]